MTKNNKGSITISVVMPKALVEKIDRIAEEEDRTKSYLIRKTLSDKFLA